MIEIFDSWSGTGQGWFLFGCMLSTVAIVAILAVNIRIVLRGYPPDEYGPIEAIHCEHDDNITHSCIKIGSNCRTQAECESVTPRQKPDA